MPADPQVFTSVAQPGNMKYTFTGLRMTFPNVAIHYVLQQYWAYRRAIVYRPEVNVEARWSPAIVTWNQTALMSMVDRIKEVTDQQVFDPDKPLKDRVKAEEDFVKQITSKSEDFEALAKAQSATHSDEFMGPADIVEPSISFDLTGNNADFPQPTSSRIKSEYYRDLMIGLDRLAVIMSNSPSSNLPNYVNPRDAAAWLTRIADIWHITNRAGSSEEPYLPDGLWRSQLDAVTNADGSLDRPASEGRTLRGEQ